MSNSGTVTNVPEQLPRIYLYRVNVVNTIYFVPYNYRHYIMTSLGDQVRNTSTEYVQRLYEIAKRNLNMSILGLEESVGPVPTTHRQYSLGPLGTQHTVPAKLAPEGPQTHTFEKLPSHAVSTADINQEASGSTPEAQNPAADKKKQKKKTNAMKHHQNKRTTESIQSEHNRRRQIYLDNIRRHQSAATNMINRCQIHGQCMHTPYLRGTAMMRGPWQQHMYPNVNREDQHMRPYPGGRDNGMFSYNRQVTPDLRGHQGWFH